MASEIRVNKINSRTGVGTITLSPTGVDFTGIATVATFSATGNATVGGTLSVTGETTFATHVNLGDNDKINVGDNDDLQISHDGSTNIISGLYHPIELRHQSEVHIKCVDDGAVELYHNNVKKLETTSGGATVIGNISLDDSTSASNGRLNIGTGDDLQIYHYDNANYIDNASSTPLYIRVNGSENAIVATANGSVDLYHDNSKKFETLTNGVRAQGGILFGSDTADANALDDYEEGTFSPTVAAGADDGSGGTPPYSIQAGRYIKIGKKVHCDIFIRFASGAYGTGAIARIGNLPFTISNDSYGTVGANTLTRGGGFSTFHNTTTDITTCYGNNGTAYFYLYKNGGQNFYFGGADNANLGSTYWIGIFEYISNI